MSEPTGRATEIHEVRPGILHWTLHDDRLDFRSDAYAVRTEEGLVAIDPLPLTEAALGDLGDLAAICLTGGFHQRAAWTLRRAGRTPVHAPRGARGLVEQPDVGYDDGATLPGGLIAQNRIGPTDPHFVFLWDTPDGGRALFCADLLMRAGNGKFDFVPDEHQDDPARTRDSVRALCDCGADTLCPAHGAPLLTGAIEAMRSALSRSRGRRFR